MSEGIVKSFIDNLPKKFTNEVIELCKKEGEQWLDDLPQTISSLEQKWEIKVAKHFPNLSYNYVASCVCKDGTPAVLKIALPLQNPEIFNEAKTLHIFRGNCAVKVLKIDKHYRAILLERLMPGNHLMEIFADNKGKSVDVAIDLMKKLYEDSPKQNDFTDVDFWLYQLNKAEKSNFTKKYVSKARGYFEELNSDKGKLKFIHGDLHHENILSVGENKFAAIDPFGINANVGYEIGLFLRVHLRWVKDEKLVAKAIEKFANSFDFSLEEVKRWAYVQHVLSACWDFEEGSSNWQTELELANTWERI